LYDEVLPFHISEVTQSIEQSAKGGRYIGKNTETIHLARLLRARRERPRCRRTTEQRDECAPLHVWMAPAWQEIIWRAAQRSLAVMCPACWCSPGGLLALMECANRVLIIRTGSMSR